MQQSPASGGGGSAAEPKVRKSYQKGIAGFLSKSALTRQKQKAKERRDKQRRKEVAAAVANPTAQERAAHIDKWSRVVRNHTERFQRNEKRRGHEEGEEKKEGGEEEEGGGRKRSKNKRVAKKGGEYLETAAKTGASSTESSSFQARRCW